MAAGEKGTVVLFDVKSGILLKRLAGHTKHVRAVVFEPQGKWLATAGDDKRIMLWSILTGEQIRQWEVADEVNALAISPDGTLLASGGNDKNISLWKSENGQLERTFEGHSGNISDLAFNATGEWLASASYDTTARLWDVKDVKNDQASHILKGHTSKVQSVIFSQDGQLLATGSNDKTVRLWRVDSDQTVRVLTGHQNKVFTLGFIGEGNYLVSASADRTLRVWDTDSGVTLRILQGHKASITGMTIHNGQLFSASTDSTVKRWDTKLPYQHIVDLPTEPASTAIAPNGNSVAVGFANGSLRLYSLPDTQLLWEQNKVHERDIQRLAFNHDGSLLASASLDTTVRLWQVKDGKLQDTLNGHTNGVNAVAFSPNGKIIATASYDGQIGLFTIGTEKGQFYQGGEEINSVAFDASGEKLLTASDYGVRLWKVKGTSLTQLQTYPKTHDIILWAALSADGQRYASVGRNFLVNVYATEGGQELYSLPGHEDSILRAAFSPDNQQVATVSGDGTVRFWDLMNSSELFTLRLPTQSHPPAPLWDFDFRCTLKGCWIAVPLTRGKLVLYEMGAIYDSM